MVDDPVRLIHILQHTAGFDDMHFNEMYNVSHPADLPLVEVLRLNPASRVVRWKPGTRMSYSNPGYGIAGYILEKVTGEKYEDRIAEHIFKPVGMTESSFHLTEADYPKLAKGYSSRGGAPVPYTQIYLRPSGNLHTTAADLGKFVHVLLNWGEIGEDLVIDPEYLSNMEHPTHIPGIAGRSPFGIRHGPLQLVRGRFSDARPQRRHRRLRLVVRVLDVTGRRLCGVAQCHALGRGHAPHFAARCQVLESRCRAAAKDGSRRARHNPA